MRAWGIKLGSGGSCVPFCESHEIVGVGWHDVDPKIVATADRAGLKKHVGETCAGWYGSDSQKIGLATGQIYRFARECKAGDLIVYYDPPHKHVRVARVVSDSLFRDFDLEEPIDIWHYRKVEIAATIPIVDFYGGLKWSVLGPKFSFWELRDAEAVEMLSRGESPHVSRASDPEVAAAFDSLRELLVRRAEALDEKDWEEVVADYFKAQGAHVDDRRVGGSNAVSAARTP